MNVLFLTDGSFSMLIYLGNPGQICDFKDAGPGGPAGTWAAASGAESQPGKKEGR